MTKNKIVIATTAFILAIVGTVLILKVVDNNSTSTNRANTQTPTAKIKADADNLKSQAVESMKDRDYTKALPLLQSAETKYTEIKDVMNMLDTKSLIHLTKVGQNPPPLETSEPLITGQ